MVTTSKKIGIHRPGSYCFSSVTDDENGLVFRLKNSSTGIISAIVRFGFVIAYRSADESAYLGYWSQKLANSSHLVWELEGSEFLEWIEAISFKTISSEDGLRHFLVATPDTCLEVISKTEPVVEFQLEGASDATE